MFLSSFFFFVRIGAEYVGPQLVARNFAVALFIEAPSERAIETLTQAHGLTEIADGCACSAGVIGLFSDRETSKKYAETVHDRILPFGNVQLSIPFGISQLNG